MADLEILALNESTPRIEAAQSGDRYLARRVIVTQLGTITADQPQELSATWNNAGVTFKGRRVVITDTASAAGSLVDEITVGGTTVFSVSKAGGVRAGTGVDLSQNNIISVSGGFRSANGDGIALFVPDGTAPIWAYSSGSDKRVAIGLNYFLGFQGSTITSDPDLKLYRDAADTLAQRRGTNPQTHRVYNTFTDASNYERFRVSWASNVCTVGLENAGTGSARQVVYRFGAYPGKAGAQHLGLSNGGISFSTDGALFLNIAGASIFGTSAAGIHVSGGLGFGSRGGDAENGSPDVLLVRAAAGIYQFSGSSSSTGGSFSALPGAENTTVTGTVNNLALDASRFQRLTGSSTPVVTGVAPPSGGAHAGGNERLIYNVGATAIQWNHNDSNSTAANRLFFQGGANVTLAQNECLFIHYDPTDNGSGSAGWRARKLSN